MLGCFCQQACFYTCACSLLPFYFFSFGCYHREVGCTAKVREYFRVLDGLLVCLLSRPKCTSISMVTELGGANPKSILFWLE